MALCHVPARNRTQGHLLAATGERDWRHPEVGMVHAASAARGVRWAETDKVARHRGTGNPKSERRRSAMPEMTLQNGTVVCEGDKVRARGEDGSLRVCTVLEVLRGGGVDKALLTAPTPFGTVIRTRYQIKPHATKPRRQGMYGMEAEEVRFILRSLGLPDVATHMDSQLGGYKSSTDCANTDWSEGAGLLDAAHFGHW